MRITSVAFIEFHWLKPTPEPECRTAPPEHLPPARGYRLPGRRWGSPFDGMACIQCPAPIIFFQPINDMSLEAPGPYLIWHRIH